MASLPLVQAPLLTREYAVNTVAALIPSAEFQGQALGTSASTTRGEKVNVSEDLLG
jgi:hypothetical protein